MQVVFSELINDVEFMYHFEKEYKKQKAKQREKILYYIKQKLSGLMFVSISILMPMIFDGDATVSILAFPLGLFLVLTKEKVMDFKGK